MFEQIQRDLVAMREVEKKAYQAGYEAGKKDAELDEKKARAEDAQIDEMEQKDEKPEKEFNDISEDLA
jgi:hypothetical protein